MHQPHGYMFSGCCPGARRARRISGRCVGTRAIECYFCAAWCAIAPATAREERPWQPHEKRCLGNRARREALSTCCIVWLPRASLPRCRADMPCWHVVPTCRGRYMIAFREWTTSVEGFLAGRLLAQMPDFVMASFVGQLAARHDQIDPELFEMVRVLRVLQYATRCFGCMYTCLSLHLAVRHETTCVCMDMCLVSMPLAHLDI
jgi:hypothetical protein